MGPVTGKRNAIGMKCDLQSCFRLVLWLHKQICLNTICVNLICDLLFWYAPVNPGILQKRKDTKQTFYPTKIHTYTRIGQDTGYRQYFICFNFN